ncbi:two component transcriptional regulator, winged helix family [Halothece sp. PCC 7418]|uniref:response regulator transcription factor NblR n=1 Tax=Halothece sp. (strain PCC 7418) TaxID=65093 RepID=UPI0002A06F3E|nr:response regulator transcription factor [Halothece sp. PCC 7418]AFZ43254.1 two component transcriptional regulator, winged helix family [Halothece sp. PCC 7418]
MSMSQPSVLVIANDPELSQTVNLDLTNAGYTVTVASNTDQAKPQFEELQPALVVIDQAHLGEEGLTVSRQLRGHNNPVLIVLFMKEDTLEDRTACLEAGADDYMLLPYQRDRFLELVQLYLQPATTVPEQLQFSDLVLDLSHRCANRNGRKIELTVKEFELLKYLMSHPGEVLTREQILDNVWEDNHGGESNVIEVYIRYLRLKIEQGGYKRLIQTVRGVGYVLRES